MQWVKAAEAYYLNRALQGEGPPLFDSRYVKWKSAHPGTQGDQAEIRQFLEDSSQSMRRAMAALEAGRLPAAHRTGYVLRAYWVSAQASPLSDYRQTMPFRVYVPSSYDRAKRWPVLIHMHGTGGTEAFGQPQREAAEAAGFLFVGVTGGGRYRRGTLIGDHDIWSVIDSLAHTHSIDPDRIFLAGSSLGAWNAWAIGMKSPDLFAGISPMWGMYYPGIELARNNTNLPVYLINGSCDFMNGVYCGRVPFKLLTEMGLGESKLTEYPGGGHCAGSRAFVDLLDWCGPLRRDPDPRRVVFSTFNPQRWDHSYWVRIDALRAIGPAGTVEAALHEGNRLEARTENVIALTLQLTSGHVDRAQSITVILDGKRAYQGSWRKQVSLRMKPDAHGGVAAWTVDDTVQGRDG